MTDEAYKRLYNQITQSDWYNDRQFWNRYGRFTKDHSVGPSATLINNYDWLRKFNIKSVEIYALCKTMSDEYLKQCHVSKQSIVSRFR
jgi:hypothetical protein